MVDAKFDFTSPKLEDIKFNNGNKNSEFDNILIKLNQQFNESLNMLNNYSSNFTKFKMFFLEDRGNRFYLRYEGSFNEYYKLLRRIALPKKSYISILKLNNQEGDILYYLRLLFYNHKLYPNNIKRDLEDFSIEEDILKQLCASLNSGQNIILEGVPGTGKTYLATKFAEKSMGDEGYILTTATSDWTTFDTIGGLMPNKDEKLIFHEGKFLQAIRENKWLIIDEINRADIDKSFGQLFTVLSGQNVELPYEINGNPIRIVNNKNLNANQYCDGTYYIGNDWRIIATMNTYDKNSLYDLSYAFMRRFMFIEIKVPNTFAFIEKLKNEDDIILDGVNERYYDKLESLFKINDNADINRKLGPAIFLDIFKYINSVSKLEGHSFDYDSIILADAIISNVIPQFEGSKNIDDIISFFEKNIFNDDGDENGLLVIKSKLNDLKVN